MRASQAWDAGSIPVIRLDKNRGLWHRLGDNDLCFYLTVLTIRREAARKKHELNGEITFSCEALDMIFGQGFSIPRYPL